jgi:hypothetical protein
MKLFSPEEARRFYNRLGRKQDSQFFSEDKATGKVTGLSTQGGG